MDAKDHRIEKECALVAVTADGARTRVPLPCNALPQLVLDVLSAVAVRLNCTPLRYIGCARGGLHLYRVS